MFMGNVDFFLGFLVVLGFGTYGVPWVTTDFVG